MKQAVEITAAAATQVKTMMKHNGEENSYLRVGVQGGGCSGLTYSLGFEKEPRESDIHYEQHEIPIVIERDDTAILEGTVVDFKQSLMGGGFTIDNPNAIASCGCGTSFRTDKKVGTPEVCE
ncbi:iron-sulfur cluster assembly accessory protein [Savagea sp. SN6]|uniref:Iron-sulfur cluster assembly accessory protein n=1 Tax=Savagea serpentis TaxID=2785297 RepID=A0A8J7KLW8_9BACL|nr:iron-sulfur cluster assembly accessory protein [Savagea serpentis]MBF4501829.1 iron-sulfur cluster assembly accessory protein [Savagea serpentis]